MMICKSCKPSVHRCSKRLTGYVYHPVCRYKFFFAAKVVNVCTAREFVCLPETNETMKVVKAEWFPFIGKPFAGKVLVDDGHLAEITGIATITNRLRARRAGKQRHRQHYRYSRF